MVTRVFYSPELAAAICERLAAGESLRAICRDDGMPAPSTVLSWKDEYKDFGEQYARAREAGYTLLAEEIIEISDDGTNDYVERENQRTGRTEVLADTDHIQRSKLRVDTRKWILSKMLPKVYGDKLEIDAKVEIGVTERLARARNRTG
jgi:transposase-like protein